MKYNITAVTSSSKHRDAYKKIDETYRRSSDIREGSPTQWWYGSIQSNGSFFSSAVYSPQVKLESLLVQLGRFLCSVKR